jgi:hypothetical protein
MKREAIIILDSAGTPNFDLIADILLAELFSAYAVNKKSNSYYQFKVDQHARSINE